MRITARHRVAVLAVAVVLGVAGCTSDDDGATDTAGTGTAVSGSGATDPASSGAASSADESSGTDEPATGASEQAAEGSGSGTTGTAGSGSEPTALPSPTSVQPSSRSPKPTPSTPKPSGSGVVAAFSQADAAWFGAMCSGLVDKPDSTLPELADQELPARRPAAAALFTDQADRLDAAVESLRQADPPSVTGGEQLSASVLDTFPKIADAARNGAATIADAGDEQAYQKAVDQALDAMNTAGADLVAFDEMMAAPAMIAQLQQVPECAPLLAGS